MYIYISSTSQITIHISSFLRRGHCKTASSCISKREIRIDDTADLARGRKSSKNNDEDIGGNRLKGQEGLGNRAVGRAPWQTIAAFRFVVRKRTGVREGYTPKRDE